MAITIPVQKGLYPLEVIYGTSYAFLDRAYVRLEQDDDGRILVHMRSKEGGDVDHLAGEFENELLNQAYRRKMAQRTSKVRDLIVQRALVSSLPEQSYLENMGGDDLDFLDDPLGIAVPWEEKFAKEEKDPEGGGEDK